MADSGALFPFVQRFVENDFCTAAGIVESMPEEKAVSTLNSPPLPMAVRVLILLQISYAAALLKISTINF